MNLTWAPFQSREEKEICKHLTIEEEEILIGKSSFYGIWVAVTLGIPIGVLYYSQSTLVLCITIPLIVIHLSFIPYWRKRQKQFMASTKWAKEQGYTLHGWKIKNNNR